MSSVRADEEKVVLVSTEDPEDIAAFFRKLLLCKVTHALQGEGIALNHRLVSVSRRLATEEQAGFVVDERAIEPTTDLEATPGPRATEQVSDGVALPVALHTDLRESKAVCWAAAVRQPAPTRELVLASLASPATPRCAHGLITGIS